MRDEQLDQRLRELPRQRASEAFTRQLMERVQPRQRAVGRGWRLRLAVPAAASALALTVLAAQIPARRERAAHQRALRELAELRREHAQVTAELRSLFEEAKRPLPVVRIASAPRNDIWLDLERLRSR